MTTGSPELLLAGRIARGVALACLAYWGVFALVVPVTNVDSQMYNLARLELALRGGLFDNAYFTSVFHVMHPWTYDAVHLPFMTIGWGYALPSYACLLGTCWIAHRMVRERLGPDAARAAVLGLLGLTCLVYQGSTTKNDIPLLFTGAVWMYARGRWRCEGRQVHVFWMVLALGFMAGSKTTGVLYACILGVWTLWEARRQASLLPKVAVGLLGAALVFGSLETYIETMRLFGKPLGPDSAVSMMKNRDGVAGGLANLSRFAARGVYVGPTTFEKPQPAAMGLSEGVKAFLAAAGWEDKGNAVQFRDRDLYLHQSGFEEFSGFGPVGTVALAVMLLALFRWRCRALWWRLAMGASAGFVLVALTVAYTDWANRYLIPFYALGTLAVVALLWGSGQRGVIRLRAPFVALAAMSAVAAPLLSFNRGPAALWAAVADRERLETSAYPLAGELRAKLRELKAETPASRVYFVACADSVILPLLEEESLEAIVVTAAVFRQLMESGVVVAGDLVAADCPVNPSDLEIVAEVTARNVYAGSGERRQVIYRVGGLR
jgi:hypothetical protein